MFASQPQFSEGIGMDSKFAGFNEQQSAPPRDLYGTLNPAKRRAGMMLL
jgi:hypothetical protein